MRVVVSLLVCSSLALAQFSQTPFVDHAEALGTAHGFELLELRLKAIAASAEADTGFAEEIEGALERDLPRFKASLAAQDAELANKLEEALEELGDHLESGGEIAETLQAALGQLERARPLVIPAVLLQDQAFAAGIMALLLLTEEGLAERFEEAAAGEETAFVAGWATQQRAKEMWAELEPLASETQRFEVNDMLQELDILFPSPELPGAAALIDPEAAEDPAQRIVGFLEELSGASLYPDRDLGQLVGLVQDLVQSGCEESDAAAGQQRLAVAGFYYAQYLGNTVAMLAPEPHETLEPLWAAFAEEGEKVETEVRDEEREMLECSALLVSFEQLGSVFGR